MIIRPQRGPQEQFLASPADIVSYGGAAGGGKTWALLAEPIRHINNPRFDAVIFRRTSPQLYRPGALYPASQDFYPLLQGRDTQPHSGVTWRFPSGAKVQLQHLQHDKSVHDWQGAEVPLIELDELVHFTASQFWYMMSRNRSLSGVRPYIRAATNPEPGWVLDLIKWWIGDDGYAIPKRGGVVRWFVRYDEQIIWADNPDDLTRKYRGTIPKSLTFIPAQLKDNRILMERDPGYLANLLGMPLVERERLLGGNWLITPSGGKVFNRAWFAVIHQADAPKGGTLCRFWDIAATEKELAGDDPDYTVGVLMRAVGGYYVIEDVIRERLEPGPTDKLMRSTAERDAEMARRTGAEYLVRWEKQPAAAGKRDNRNMIRLFDGFDCRGVKPEGDKITRALPFSRQVEGGFVLLVQAAWNEAFLQELHHLPDWDHDDQMDAGAGAYNVLVTTGATSDLVDFYAPHASSEGDGPEQRSERDVIAMLEEYERRL